MTDSKEGDGTGRSMFVMWIYLDSRARYHYKSGSYGQTSLLGLNLIMTCIVGAAKY